MGILYNNNFNNTERQISNNDLMIIEAMYKFTFPKDIREHYLTYNGGEPEKYVLRNGEDEYIVNGFIPIKYNLAKGATNLEFVLEILRKDNILPEWLIPFADDSGGNFYCFSIRKSDEGSIYYWSHEVVDKSEKPYIYI